MSLPDKERLMRRKDPFSPAFGRVRAGEVFGVRIPEPRVTWAGMRLALLYLGAPMMAGLLAFDLVVYLIGALAFDACWAVWCLF